MIENTKFCYQYRDSSNYKTFNEVIVKGVLELEILTPYLKDCEFFIPSEVGLEDLQATSFTPDDHVWHEIVACDKTKDTPTVPLEAKVLIKSFQVAFGNNWNEREVFEIKGLL